MYLNNNNESILQSVITYDDTNVLLLNNKIIYEDKKLFEYNIELQTTHEPDFSDPYVYNFMKYRYVDYHEIREIEEHSEFITYIQKTSRQLVYP